MLGSALGFEEGDITVYQVLAARPGAPHTLPLQRSLGAEEVRCEGGRNHGRPGRSAPWRADGLIVTMRVCPLACWSATRR